MGRPKKTGVTRIAPWHMSHFWGQPDERGHVGRTRPLQFGDDCAHAWPAAGRRVRTRLASETLIGSVLSIATDDAADDREPIHHRSHLWEELANLESGDLGFDR